MKKILFPTDFSEAADHAFIYALNVADKLGASIVTAHAYHLPYIQAVQLPRTLKQVYDSIVIEEFDNYRDHVPHLREIAAEQHMGHIRVQHVMVESRQDITKALLGVASQNSVDMIIMGTTGASGLKEIFLGSVAAEMLENACCPVLAVPLKAVFDGKIDRIAMTTEFAENEKETLKKVMVFADLFEAQVYLVHVDTTRSEEHLHQMDNFKKDLDQYPNLFVKVIGAISVEAALSHFIEKDEIDVLAMLTHKRSFFQELFTYSMTKKMAYHLRVPVLAFQNDVKNEVEGEKVITSAITP